MQYLKSNLHIVGNPGVGKTRLIKSLNELFNFRVLPNMDRFNGHEWEILTNNFNLKVDIKEYRSKELESISFGKSETKDIILYVSEIFESKITFKFDDEYIYQLRELSKKAIVVIATHFFAPYAELKGGIGHLKKFLPFVEYFLPLNDFDFRNYEDTFQLGYTLRQLIINTFPQSLDHVRELIRNNYETKEPTLDIGNCGLTSLNDIKELFNLTHLKKLILSNEWGEFVDGYWERKTSKNEFDPNVFFIIPKNIEKLKNLEVLIAGGNWETPGKGVTYFPSSWYISDIRSLSKLNKLSIINLSNNEIASVIPLSDLKSLTRLYLNNNIIKYFPNIGKFPALKELYLSNNRISSVKFLTTESNKIHTVDLHSNQIKDLTPIRNLIAKIDIKNSKWENKTISILKNPLSVPPMEVVANGRKSVEAYFSQLDAETEIRIRPYNNNEIKLIMVGNSNVGKSTFVHWLKTGKVDKTIETTHWLALDSLDLKKGRKNYKVRIFDFGGQEYYHDTHHLFFTNRTAYVLLWDKLSNRFDEVDIEQTQRGGKKRPVKIETFPLEYWLDSIRYHTQKRKLTQTEQSISKIFNRRDQQIEKTLRARPDLMKAMEIFLYGSEKSLNETDEENILVLQNKVDSKEFKSLLNEFDLKRNYPKIYDFEQISLFKENRLELAQSLLFDIFDSIEILNRQFLGTWNRIKLEIEKNTFVKSYSLVDFQNFCNEIIKRMPDLKGKSPKQISKVLFSKDDTKVFASFLADIGLCLYYPENSELSEKVFLNQKKILGDLNNVLLSINRINGEISELEISNTLGKSEGSIELIDIINLMLHFKILFKHPIVDRKSYIAPLYLPIAPPKSIKLFQPLFKNPVYRFIYETFIHKSIVLDLFQKYGSIAMSENSDDSSFYFWKNGIIIKCEESENICMIKFSTWNSEDKCAVLDIFSLNGTNDKFIESIVEHVDHINQGIKAKKLVPDVNDRHYVPLELILQNEKDGNPTFLYNKKYYNISSFKTYLKTPLKMKKLFISYSKQDLRLVNKFLEHLSALQRDGKIAHWYCSELEAGSNWNDEIQGHFDDADIVCFMISPNFMKTDYIHEHEIKKAFERKKENPNLKIVPIILNYCRWTTVNNNLGDFTALPYTAKPVMDFKNQDMAWYIIETCLRYMIDNDLNPTGDNFYINQQLPADVLKIYQRIVDGKVDDNSI